MEWGYTDKHVFYLSHDVDDAGGGDSIHKERMNERSWLESGRFTHRTLRQCTSTDVGTKINVKNSVMTMTMLFVGRSIVVWWRGTIGHVKCCTNGWRWHRGLQRQRKSYYSRHFSLCWMHSGPLSTTGMTISPVPSSHLWQSHLSPSSHLSVLNALWTSIHHRYDSFTCPHHLTCLHWMHSWPLSTTGMTISPVPIISSVCVECILDLYPHRYDNLTCQS